MSSSSATASKVSFTIRRPTPVSRQGSSGPDSDREGSFKLPLPPKRTDSGRSTPASPLASGGGAAPVRRAQRPRYEQPDSSDEEEAVDEIVTGFDQFGVQRLKEKPKAGPLVIPALANRDWRDAARKRKAAELFAPASGRAATGADGSVGGLGTRDVANAGPVHVGLVAMEKRVKVEPDVKMEPDVEPGEAPGAAQQAAIKEESEDERARRALLAGMDANGELDSGLLIDAIPSGGNDWRPKDETDAYRQDVVTRPNEATLEDYARVPVAEFGAALLRGMGWTPGTAASRTRTGPVTPYLPAARPALLGIGAKAREAVDDGSGAGKKAKQGVIRPERRYVPLVKRERERDGTVSRDDSPRRGSAPSSRRASRSPDPTRRREDRDYDRKKGTDGERSSQRRDRDYESDRDKRKDKDSNGNRDGARNRDYDSDRDMRKDRARDSERHSDRELERDRRR